VYSARGGRIEIAVTVAADDMAKSVLIVDDNAAIRQCLKSVFTCEDFYVGGEAENGREAIAKAEELIPDLIVMDLSMPVMNGMQAAAVLHKLMPKLPIVLFSEYAYSLSPKDASSSGFSAFVSKSENTAVLLEKARALVSHRAA
jgi:DNA-binding NarL/FixJ family response regulator